MKRFFGLLLRLLPAPFRARFGAEMKEQILSDYERARSRGALSAAAFATIASLDLTRSALAERWRPTWAPVPTRQPAGRRMTTMLRNMWVDCAYALRALRRAPRFTALAAGTLGLALGALAGIFAVVEAVLLRALPYSDPERLVFIVASAPGSDMPDEFGVSPEMYLQYQEARLLEEVAFQGYGGTRTLRLEDRAERIPMWLPSIGLFRTLGVEPLLGRLPGAEDDGKVALISHRLWTTHFDSDPRVIGRSIEADGATRTIIAVMKPDFWLFNDGFQLWLPYEITPEMLGEPGRFEARLIGRISPGATLDAVSEELTQLARRLPERVGGSPSYARLMQQHRAVVRPIEENLVYSFQARVLWILLGSAAIVLVIACANVASLFLMRAERSRHDHAVRRTLGSTRARLFRVELAESLVVALLGGALAVVFAQVVVPVFVRAAPQFALRMGELRLTVTSLFAVAVALVCGLLCGIAPAFRCSGPLTSHLREGGRGATRRRRPAQELLLVAQTALALVLLIGSGLLARNFWSLSRVDLGYDTDDILTFQFAPEGAELVDGPSYARLHLAFMERLAALPEVKAVGVVNNVPLDEGVDEARFIPGDGTETAGAGMVLGYTYAAGDYFRAMGIDVQLGRTFTRADHVSDLGNVVVSRAAADLLWPGEEPLGRGLRRDGSEVEWTVIGVVEDVAQDDFRDAPIVYLPLVGPTPTSWSVSSPGYVVKTSRAEAMIPEIRRMIREVAPGAPMYAVQTMESLAADELSVLRFTMLTLGVGAVLSMILGAVGLFGVLSYVVAERTREIGVRMVLGARAAEVRRMVVRQGTRVVVVGVVIGLGLAAVGRRAFGDLPVEGGAFDVLTFAGTAGLMLAVGLLASYLPARRASSVDPLTAIREV